LETLSGYLEVGAMTDNTTKKFDKLVILVNPPKFIIERSSFK